MNASQEPFIKSPLGYTVGGPDAPNVDFTKTIPSFRYTSPEYMREEWDKVWTKTWMIAGREQLVPISGDWMRFEVGPASILVVRGDDGRLRAFHNVCRHRGNQIIRAEGHGHVKHLTCSYHGWSWNCDGSLRAIRDPETFQGLPECAKLGLVPVSVGTWGGFVFVNLDPHAAPLLDYLGPIPGMLDRFGPEKMKLVQRFEVEVACNWKTGLDGFTETYHFNIVHPQVASIVNDLEFRIMLYDLHNFFEVRFGEPSPRLDVNRLTPAMREYMNPSAGALDGSAKSQETDRELMDIARLDPALFEGRASEVRRATQLKKRAAQDRFPWLPYANLTDDELTNNYQFLCFPNTHINTFAENMLTFSFWPHVDDPNKCIFHLGYYNHVAPDKVPPIPPIKHVVGDDPAIGMLMGQDIRIMESLQKGMRSGAVPDLYANEIEGKIVHFHHVLERHVGR